MRKFLASAAVLALVPLSVQADPGGGKGGGQGKGDGNAGGQQADPRGGAGRGQGTAKIGRGLDQHSEGGPATVDMRGDNGKGKGKDNGGDNGGGNRSFGNDNSPGVEIRWNRGSGLISGCPPGLAKKNNGCLPPGLARDSHPFANSDWYRMRGLENGDYRYHDGYLLRMGGGGVQGYIPLLGGALSFGNPWPNGLNSVALPGYYQEYYGLGNPNGYRYYGDTIYRVDPQSSAISSIAALLTGDRFAVGQRIPQGYDVYNVPYNYRDRYTDGPDSLYRYSDGYVYQVDPTTQLVQSVIQLLT
jgi:hypothetical protein